MSIKIAMSCNTPRSLLCKTKQIGVGLSFVLFPLIFIFAFGSHPNLLNPKFLGPTDLINRIHHASILHFGHALVTICTGLLVVVALHFMKLLENSSATWHGLVGGVLAIFGSLMLAADKGALCLTMSALDNLSDSQFNCMLPGLLSIFEKSGYLFLLWGMIFIPIGFIILIIGLIKTSSFPFWQSILFLIGVLFIATPDGVEIANLCASVLVAFGVVPYGVKMIFRGK